jgi:putative spermidine/putrescine transport system substrate-binding protein
MKTDFFAKYPFLKHNDLNPDASSGDEIEAVKANAGNKGPQNPDVLDVGFIWGQLAKSQGLLQPYKVETWDSIPDAVKDADGFYYGNYYGTMVFEVNADVVTNIPQDWSDLLKPEYKGQIAMSGDPTAASQAIHTVWAAAIGAGAKNDDPTLGLEFFKQLAESGNLIATPFTPAGLVKGETPITFRWDYNALANRDNNMDAAKIEIVYPKSGSIAGVYLCGINAYAPRPNAGRLWMEYVYSDEGQLTFLSGYATPIRFADLKARNVIPQELLDKLPVSDIKVAFPNVEEITKSLEVIRKGWPEIVGLELAK